MTGFLGGHLAARLTRAGVRVRGLGRNEEKGRILSQQLGVEFIPHGSSDARVVAAACQDVDTVFHVAALSSPWGKRENFVRANVDLTRKILTAARAVKVGRLRGGQFHGLGHVLDAAQICQVETIADHWQPTLFQRPN